MLQFVSELLAGIGVAVILIVSALFGISKALKEINDEQRP